MRCDQDIPRARHAQLAVVPPGPRSVMSGNTTGKLMPALGAQATNASRNATSSGRSVVMRPTRRQPSRAMRRHMVWPSLYALGAMRTSVRKRRVSVSAASEAEDPITVRPCHPAASPVETATSFTALETITGGPRLALGSLVGTIMRIDCAEGQNEATWRRDQRGAPAPGPRLAHAHLKEGHVRIAL